VTVCQATTEVKQRLQIEERPDETAAGTQPPVTGERPVEAAAGPQPAVIEQRPEETAAGPQPVNRPEFSSAAFDNQVISSSINKA